MKSIMISIDPVNTRLNIIRNLLSEQKAKLEKRYVAKLINYLCDDSVLYEDNGIVSTAPKA